MIEEFFRSCRLRRVVSGVAVSLVMVLVLFPGRLLQAQEILSHRAVYKLSLQSAKPRSQIVGALGKMNVEIVEDCAGWSSSQYLDLSLRNQEGGSVDTVTQFASWESRDGLSYRFNIRVAQSGQTIEQYNGQALREKKGDPVQVTYLAPEAKNVTFDADVLFPVEHLKGLITAARDKNKLYARTVFDGATESGAYHINAVIGTQVKDKGKGGQQEGLGNAYWPTRLAFFSLARGEDLPEYESSVQLVENGVVREFIIDYGDFVIRAALEKIEALARPSC